MSRPPGRKQPSFRRTFILLCLLFGLSLALYIGLIVLPYDIFTHVDRTPISMPEIADRKPLPAALFLLTFAALFALYAIAYRLCRLQPARELAPFVLLLGLALALPLCLTYPIGAGDVVDYVTHGEELAYFGENPLVIPPAWVEGARFAAYSAFRYISPNYGPLWIHISALVAWTMGNQSLLLNLLGFKAVAVLSYLAQAVFIYVILRRREPTHALAGLLFFAWNPLILYEFAVNGHNDATMMALALLGILFWELERPLLMTAALTLSLLIKIPTAPLMPLFLLAAARARSDRLLSFKTLFSGGLLVLAIVGLAYFSLPDPLPALTNLSQRSDLFTHSLPMIVSLLLRMAGWEREAVQQAVRLAALAALGGWYGIRLISTWVKPGRALENAYLFVLFLLLFTTLWFQPWYATWLVALAALRPTPSAPGQAGLFSATVMVSYVVYGFVWFWIPHIANWENTLGINLMAVGTSFLLPWAYSAWLLWKRRHLHQRQKCCTIKVL